MWWQEMAFQELVGLDLDSRLEALVDYLPEGGEIVFPQHRLVEDLYTSYKDNNYHFLLYGLIRVLKPDSTVELGVLQGFSLFSMGFALRDNEHGKILGFDLFEDYPYRHEQEKNVARRIVEFGLGQYIQIRRADAFGVYRRFGIEEVDLLHVDISNNGDILRRMFLQWAPRVKTAMIFEGGSEERDQIEWMIKYEKPPMHPAIQEIAGAFPAWELITLEAYPSITIAWRKG